MSYTNGLDKPTDYFNTKLYTGNGTDAHAITGVGFQPDFVWIKSRNDVRNHALQDSVRGATKYLYSNLTDAEGTASTTLQSFDSDGFTLGTANSWNRDTYPFVSWNWLAGGTASSNTDGSITSNVSANTTAGFSIVSYTGDGTASTIGHGLGVTPSMVIVKNRSEAYSWNCYHQSLGETKYILLNSTNASATGNTWNNTAPTSSVFSIGGAISGVSKNGNNYIAYCFAEKKGFSKFGSYTGNGSTDGTFVYTGFKPAWVMVKSSSAVESWYTYDNKRNTFNPLDKGLTNNQNIAEFTFDPWDFTSNGFKARQNWPGNNSSGTTYIYMAFAESPFVTGTSGIPTTAR